MDIRFVYGIYCGKRLLYIGSTKSPGSRCIDHIYSVERCENTAIPLYPMLSKLFINNIPIRFKILFMGGGREGWRMERKLIKKYAPLLEWQQQGVGVQSRRDVNGGHCIFIPEYVRPNPVMNNTVSEMDFADYMHDFTTKSIGKQICRICPPEKYFILFEK